MKILTALLFVLLLNSVYAQSEEYIVLLDSAKTMFKKGEHLSQSELDTFDYEKTLQLFQKVIDLNPESAEARYFLAYTYSQINSRDGRGLIDLNLTLINKATVQLKKVIELSPAYKGEIITLDPYSKISSEWGAMAMSYWYKNKLDSAIWAFEKGKSQGGYSDYMLATNKNTLAACSENAILFSYGDNSTFSLLYLQLVENFRTDVSVVDLSLLNTKWYPRFLIKHESLAFDLPVKVIDTINYLKWSDSTITIGDFSWLVEPRYHGYLLRGDQLFLSLLRENNFKRDLFFSIGMAENAMLSLKKHLSSVVVADYLKPDGKDEISYNQYKKAVIESLKLAQQINLNSPDQFRILDYYRFNLFSAVNERLDDNKRQEAEELLNILEKNAPQSKFPYSQEQGRKYLEYLKGRL